MSGTIDPEAAEPSTIQSAVLSDRNPAVVKWGGSDAEGGQIASPSAGESRVTAEGPAVPANAGLKY